MEITLFITSIVVAALGIILLIIPIIPAPVVSFIGLLVYYFSGKSEDSVLELVIWGVFMIVVLLMDNILPPMIARKFGGSKKAAWGSFIGVLIGAFFVPPIGMLVGAFVGALIGEAIHTNKMDSDEMKVAFGSFLGFITGMGLKLAYGILILCHIIFS
ncbi:MAG: DUF456 domain-containing protein [Rikenellaceae bacterium]